MEFNIHKKYWSATREETVSKPLKFVQIDTRIKGQRGMVKKKLKATGSCGGAMVAYTLKGYGI